MKPPQGSPPWLAVRTAEEEPDPWEEARRDRRFRDLWPEYNHHGVHAPRLFEDYARWQREDGLPFDPWLRVHARMGATMLRAEPRSMEITAEVADWEAWVGMPFPRDGRYVFPRGLAPLVVSRGIGQYFEPNVWMLHRVERT